LFGKQEENKKKRENKPSKGKTSQAAATIGLNKKLFFTIKIKK
jgi:hypothetical protein